MAYIVRQNIMNTPSHLDDASILNAGIAEEREYQLVLERKRLEEAAARPISFWDGWTISIFLGVPVVLYLQGRHEEIWVVILLLILKLIYSVYTGIHARIDALVDLGRLKNLSPITTKEAQAEQDGTSNGG
jgi:hypothetical protein